MNIEKQMIQGVQDESDLLSVSTQLLAARISNSEFVFNPYSQTFVEDELNASVSVAQKLIREVKNRM